MRVFRPVLAILKFFLTIAPHLRGVTQGMPFFYNSTSELTLPRFNTHLHFFRTFLVKSFLLGYLLIPCSRNVSAFQRTECILKPPFQRKEQNSLLSRRYYETKFFCLIVIRARRSCSHARNLICVVYIFKTWKCS